MKKQFSRYALLFLLGTQACNSSDKPTDAKVATDTVAQTQVVQVPVEVDTAAIIAYYTTQKAKAKGTPNTVKKQQGQKNVSVDSDPTFASSDVISEPAKDTSSGAGATDAKVTKLLYDDQMFYFLPDEVASFPGGEKAFDKYLIDNLQYPPKALEANGSRTVYPTVFLDEQGTPVDVTFRYEPTVYGFQDEARRILMKSPRWNPAKVDGKPVKSKFTIPISFQIQ